jgi:hypothetical protein
MKDVRLGGEVKMKKSEILENYWEEFLRDCHYNLVSHSAHDSDARDKAQPTETNFWLWYMKNKMEQDHGRINEYLKERKH